VTLSTTKWPIRKIIYGIWFESMKSFINSRTGVKDHFESHKEAADYIKGKFTPREIKKQGIWPKPLKRLGQNSIDEEDV
jgi:hypothetical protein